ncbi:MAG: hypothetical protein A2122_00620 [Candidatus Liptonbacteria bacterium GWB1_49_6]|uniref:Class I SAM-dependent methyltransferase n=1 Tax=Candidatus Liptonbacteria bacterium GWB1_49_6 TaxID=1798644 RepID=A0A1G2C6S8_9BACT|nr:MAG: hypothetical protein A2122_00620 [Candidatus Liptonbacteria bacterium GWB1_49_6]
MNSLKHFLRIRAPFIFKFVRAAKHFPSRIKRAFIPYRFRMYAEAFHGDKQWQELVALFAKLPITSCVETGTYHADTTLYLAKVFPNISVYTVELAGEYYRESAWRLRDSKNVALIRDSSPRAITNLVSQNRLGAFSFVFLDAHWYDYWPILDELTALAPVPKVIIIIDDFEVPGKEWFQYDVYYKGEKKLKNNLEFIAPAIGGYKILFPQYSPQEAGIEGSVLRGYVVLFKGFSDEEWDNVKKIIPERDFRVFAVK